MEDVAVEDVDPNRNPRDHGGKTSDGSGLGRMRFDNVWFPLTEYPDEPCNGECVGCQAEFPSE